VVNIRSTGGDMNDALLIHDALAELKAKIHTRCYGYTASAATIIAQAASEGCREISTNALYLIHKSMLAVEGNEDEIARQIDLLKKTDERIAGLYAARSGKDAESFVTLMSENNGNGKWLSPDETIAAGLADAKFSSPEILNVAVINETPNNKKAKMKIKKTYNAILRHLGITPKEEDVEVEVSEDQFATVNQAIEQAEQHESELRTQLEAEQTAHKTTNEELVKVQNRVKELEAEVARNAAGPTETKPIEDPAPVDDVKLTGNAASYAEDLKNFK
jgi:ATP-dependent Clp protease protease subunit